MKKNTLFNIITIVFILLNVRFLLANLRLALPKYLLTLDASNVSYSQIENLLKSDGLLRNTEFNNITKIEMYQEFPNGNKLVIYYTSNNINNKMDLSISNDSNIYSYMLENGKLDITTKLFIDTIFIITILLIVIFIVFNITILINKFCNSDIIHKFK